MQRLMSHLDLSLFILVALYFFLISHTQWITERQLKKKKKKTRL